MALYPAVESTAIEDGLDRLNLVEIRKRFLQVNRQRLQRTRTELNHRQASFLDTLPLLFHCNHPMLPGFVTHSTPAGVSGFKPSKQDIINGKALARSFCLNGSHHGDDIWGIYLMGSTGTLAQSSSSDFDVWVCHKPGLSQTGLRELELKCERISQWAKDRRVDAHFFAMDCTAFKEGQTLSLDEESSGSAQRLLLLDEFYRTGLYIAGRLPLWWFAPCSQEADYDRFTAQLLDRRFLRPATTLDFGGLSQIPSGEFVGAGIWQLYKAIASPYKSVLKLLLMEAYVCDYPTIRPLALDFKELVYRGECAIDKLDPYLLLYRRIEHYLQSIGDDERLELARRCFYFKVGKALSHPPSQRGKSWQRRTLETLTREWGWSDDYIANLDRRANWKTQAVKEQRSQLVHALNRSYEFLQTFAADTGAVRTISANELHVLGRKLQAAFERRPDKLEWVNPGISKDISEPVFRLVHSQTWDEQGEHQQVWQLFGSETGEDTPLRQTNSPVELLLWCYYNGVVQNHSRFELTRAPELNTGQIKRILSRMQQWLPLPRPPQSHARFQQAASPLRVFMIVNVGTEPQYFDQSSGLQRLSDNTDPFCYGGLEENLVACVDVLIDNSWQEITCQRFIGKQALLQALKCYTDLCLPGSHHAPPELDIECLGQHNAASITQRTRRWFEDIAQCYYSGTKPAATRYLFYMAGSYHSLQFRGPRLTVLEHRDQAQLIRYLGEAQKRYSPMVIDSFALLKSPLKLVCQHATPRAIHVFFQREKDCLSTYIVDERGSLLQFFGELTPKLHSLNSLHYFLRKVLVRQNALDDRLFQTQFGVQPIRFHEIRHDNQQRPYLATRAIAPEISQSHVLDLTARVAVDSDGHFQYSFACLRQDFTWETFGQDVFYATAQFILKQRQTNERYPVFITDLDLQQCREQLSSSRALQTSHYLRIKNELERKLSRAILSLQA